MAVNKGEHIYNQCRSCWSISCCWSWSRRAKFGSGRYSGLGLSSCFLSLWQVYFLCTGHSFLSVHWENLWVEQKRRNRILGICPFSYPWQLGPYWMKNTWTWTRSIGLHQLPHCPDFPQIFCNRFRAILPTTYPTKLSQLLFGACVLISSRFSLFSSSYPTS